MIQCDNSDTGDEIALPIIVISDDESMDLDSNNSDTGDEIALPIIVISDDESMDLDSDSDSNYTPPASVDSDSDDSDPVSVEVTWHDAPKSEPISTRPDDSIPSHLGDGNLQLADHIAKYGSVFDGLEFTSDEELNDELQIDEGYGVDNEVNDWEEIHNMTTCYGFLIDDLDVALLDISKNAKRKASELVTQEERVKRLKLAVDMM